MTDLSRLEHYRKNLCGHARKVLDLDVEVTPHGAPPGVYGSVAPVEVLQYSYTEFLCERFVCEAVVNAEHNGYDAFTIGCYLDTGLRRARSLVDIPVLGITETSMLVACTLGKSFGIVTISESMAEHLWDSAVSYGLEKRAASILSVSPEVDEYMMEDPEGNGAEIERRFFEACDKAIAKGADVLIPGEGVINELMFERGISTYRSIPILDGNAVMWQYAVMLARLKQNSGLTTGRGRLYAKPPQTLLNTLHGVHRCYDLKEHDFS